MSLTGGFKIPAKNLLVRMLGTISKQTEFKANQQQLFPQFEEVFKVIPCPSIVIR